MPSQATRPPSLTHSVRTASSSDHGLETPPPGTHSPAASILSSKPLPVPPPEHPAFVQLSLSRTQKRSRPPRIRVSPTTALLKPRVFTAFLIYVSWEEFETLALSSKTWRNSLRDAELRDVLLSRFVPGYSVCRSHADMFSFRDVLLDFTDLQLFMSSQDLQLHKYPMHALTILSASQPSTSQSRRSHKYAAFCQAHSRFVLLLQSLVHSSPFPFAEESDDTRWRPRPSAAQNVRELVFPAPLSYFGNPASVVDRARETTSRKHRSVSSVLKRSGTRISEDGVLGRRFSVFGGSKAPPPPSADPHALKLYAESWRGWRRALNRSGTMSEGEDDRVFRPPHRRFASTAVSSQSSLDTSPNTSPSSQGSGNAPAAPTISSLHDIRMAASRLRAPVLRVFHPCSQMDDDAIAACETQLDDAGLWEHLSTGDVVCNLGFLPPEEEKGSDSDHSSVQDSEKRLWLLFDGTALVPYVPPAQLPLADPLTLPSPMYYAHILPPLLNPTYLMALPRCTAAQLSLVYMPTQVVSPHSPTGFARTKRYMWTARLPPKERPGLGEGWQGQWVLEGEGTKEGKEMLLDALRGDSNKPRKWEVVIEKSSASRLWLRLVVAIVLSR
ncbi:hypothetical protein EVG20_g8672 [Dentipellis fragilis]|uniref:Uncharacterized protein n=1 Tax=Dentipellis fragilis TaxID=205917 RepID=A0A4Y9Y8F1_9AGAM|nr:hypothetical protein EVG20_g8672 [Dentipellis fragilis]